MRFVRALSWLFVVISLLIPTVSRAENKIIAGSGGTAIFPLLSKWAATYKEKTGIQIDYQPLGSGAGIEQIKAKTVAFANSDKPLKPEELRASGLVQFPAVVIGITPVVNLPNIKAGDIVFDGKVLADIFLGKISKWNDNAIHTLNPTMALPDLAITVVHRSDSSGTTFNFANYLSKVSAEWDNKVGADTTVKWPTGVASKGSAGVAASVQQTSGAIGYVEYAYARENKLIYIRLKNADGRIVEPSLDSFAAAAVGADFAAIPDFYLILTNQPGANSWPITAGTYIMMRRDAAKDANMEVLKFISWCLTEGQAQARSLDYVPLPEMTVRWVKGYWRAQLGVTF